MNAVAEYVVVAAIVVGAVFTLVGSYGLVKLGRPMSRVHAPTKAGTLGVGSILVASIVYSFATGVGSLHEILILVFLFVTAPVSAHFIAKVHIHGGNVMDEPPPPPEDSVWATLKTTPEKAG